MHCFSHSAATATRKQERKGYGHRRSEVEREITLQKQTYLAEREPSSFIAAVTQLYGPEQARLSAHDWLDESDLMDSPPQSEDRNWRAVTIAASARIANTVNVKVASGGLTQYIK